MKKIVLIVLVLASMTGCQSAMQSAYYGMWEKLGVEKREILVDRVEDAQDSQKDAQEQFANALEEFSALINFKGGELEEVYSNLNDQFMASQASASTVTERINKVEAVASALFAEWESELSQISNTTLRRDSQMKLNETQRKYNSLVRTMRKVESSMPPVLSALQDNVLYLKHNLNANAIGALQGELNNIKQDVNTLIVEMNKAITQSDEFISSIRSE